MIAEKRKLPFLFFLRQLIGEVCLNGGAGVD